MTLGLTTVTSGEEDHTFCSGRLGHVCALSVLAEGVLKPSLTHLFLPPAVASTSIVMAIASKAVSDWMEEAMAKAGSSECRPMHLAMIPLMLDKDDPHCHELLLLQMAALVSLGTEVGLATAAR